MSNNFPQFVHIFSAICSIFHRRFARRSAGVPFQLAPRAGLHGGLLREPGRGVSHRGRIAPGNQSCGEDDLQARGGVWGQVGCWPMGHCMSYIYIYNHIYIDMILLYVYNIIIYIYIHTYIHMFVFQKVFWNDVGWFFLVPVLLVSGFPRKFSTIFSMMIRNDFHIFLALCKAANQIFVNHSSRVGLHSFSQCLYICAGVMPPNPTSWWPPIEWPGDICWPSQWSFQVGHPPQLERFDYLTNRNW